MADTKKTELTFQGKPISEVEALKLIAAIYGDKRAPDIIAGLASGLHSCASVAGGFIEVTKPEK